MLTGSKNGTKPLTSVTETAQFRRQQETLLAQARSLRAQFGPPEQRLAEFLADMPPEDDAFWVEVLETS